MKTLHIIKLTLMMVLTPFIFASCSKTETDSVNTANSSKVSFNNGVIFYKGYSESGTKQMQVVLSNRNANFYNISGSASSNDTLVSAIFYSETDNQIPSGIYTYSNLPDESPFTFGNASLYLQSADYSSSPPISTITNGSIKLVNDGSQYHITFQCVLSSGEIFQSEFHGGMSYFDAHQ